MVAEWLTDQKCGGEVSALLPPADQWPEAHLGLVIEGAGAKAKFPGPIWMLITSWIPFVNASRTDKRVLIEFDFHGILFSTSPWINCMKLCVNVFILNTQISLFWEFFFPQFFFVFCDCKLNILKVVQTKSWLQVPPLASGRQKSSNESMMSIIYGNVML